MAEETSSAEIDSQEHGTEVANLSRDKELNLAGVALIKAEFIIPHSRGSHEDKSEGGESQPPPAKKRRRGQNKHRPRAARINFSEMLCPSLYDLRTPEASSTASCRFGEKCRYMHDLVKFMSEKPPDISDHCYVFESHGLCPYGMACRFSASHVTSEFVNLVKEGVHDPTLQGSTLNLLSKTLQENLRKRKVVFERSERYLERLRKSKESEVIKECGEMERRGENSDAGVVCGEVQRREENGDAGVVCGEVEMREENGDAGVVCGKVQRRGENGDVGVMCGERLVQGDAEEREKGETQVREGDVREEKQIRREHTEGGGCEVGKEDVETHGKREEGKEKVYTSQVDGKESTSGAVTDEGEIRLRNDEKKTIDFRGKLFLAPLTTTGNLPFRRVCKEFGADITCGEMAMSTNLLQGKQGEWALLKRHQSEDLFGVQVCGAHADTMTKCAELINNHTTVDFVDVNTGCPIDLVFQKGAGSALMGRQTRFEGIVRGMVEVLDCPLTVKMRAGIHKKNWNAHKLVPKLKEWGVSLVTVHGRSREQRYTKLADWEYIRSCVEAAGTMPLFGNGDVLSYEDYNTFCRESGVAGCMIARGALIKPWVFTEIKEQRHWDIRSSERLDILRRYTNYGLEHWGSDTQGVENTRKFLLEWLSFLHRYIPVGLLERPPQKINQRPPYYWGRDDLETLMASNNCQDWIKISEMLLGPAPGNFSFLPKHKANSYS